MVIKFFEEYWPVTKTMVRLYPQHKQAFVSAKVLIFKANAYMMTYWK